MQADRRGADVVLEGARPAEPASSRSRSAQVVPAEVDRERHVPVDRVDPAGDADADGGDVVGGLARRGERGIDAGRDGLGGTVRSAT